MYPQHNFSKVIKSLNKLEHTVMLLKIGSSTPDFLKLKNSQGLRNHITGLYRWPEAWEKLEAVSLNGQKNIHLNTLKEVDKLCCHLKVANVLYLANKPVINIVMVHFNTGSSKDVKNTEYCLYDLIFNIVCVYYTGILWFTWEQIISFKWRGKLHGTI